MLTEPNGTLEAGEASTDTNSAQVGYSSVEIPAWVAEFFRCKEWIEAALAASPLRLITARDVFDEIMDGRAHLWAGSKSCHVVQVFRIGRSLVAQAWLAGGDLEELLAMTPGIEAWAKAKGCRCALVTGRRGWIKALAGRGYREAHTTLVKDLTDG